MLLSEDLISKFVKITKDTTETKKESTVYGTIRKVKNDEETYDTYVRFDGSDIYTPVATTVSVADGERVVVSIHNHTATITGSLSSPAANVDELASSVELFGYIVSDKVTTDELVVERGRIDALEAADVTIKNQLTAAEGRIATLETDNLTVNEKLVANEASIENLEATKLDVLIAEAKYATIENLDAANASIYNLEATYGDFVTITTNRFDAMDANIANLETTKLSAEQAALTYANIDFSNIGEAAMEYFYANSGLIEDVVVGDGTITGLLIGVTIKGDTIEAGTLVADRLVIQGEDGLYYKLNTDGVTTEAEQTEYNSLHGSIITAKSITATQVSVDDLVAFDATIGGFNITENSIYSEVKDGEGNTTRGIYMDTDGQINFGDETNFIKYYKDEDGTYKLAISAESILYAIGDQRKSLGDLGALSEYVKIGTYDNEPCIELGESDSEFRLIITNTRILFTEGSSIPAYITNQSLHISKAVVEEELQQGGFVWKIRSNGNLGLVWKGVTE